MKQYFIYNKYIFEKRGYKLYSAVGRLFAVFINKGQAFQNKRKLLSTYRAIFLDESLVLYKEALNLLYSICRINQFDKGDLLASLINGECVIFVHKKRIWMSP